MRSSALAFLVCLLVFPLASCGSTSGVEPGTLRVGSRAPSFSLKSLDGATVTSSSFEGNIVVLNFWATWCGPCVKEIPDLKQVAATSGARVVGIALDEDGLKAVKPFVDRYGINDSENYTVLLGDQELFQRFNGYGIPYTLVLDRSQRVVKIYRGPTTQKSLEEDLKSIARGA